VSAADHPVDASTIIGELLSQTAAANARFFLPVKLYYSLAKPGVLLGNVITGVAGFLLAAGNKNNYDIGLLLATIIGMTLVIAAACVTNNVLDRDIDAKMARTKGRAVAAGKVAPRPATVYAVILAIIGFAVLIIFTNWLVVAIGAAGFIVYVWLYGATSKRHSIHGTLVGSISGAFPILAGYVAATDRFDWAALLLFLMLFFWQFPEFYSIAIYRRQEYKAANIPVMPLVKGVKSTKFQIFVYTLLFVIASLLLTILGYTGWIYFIVMLVVGLVWLRLGWQGLKAKDENSWARKMFHTSLNVLLLLSLMLAVGPLLP
ncbi:MAG: heme o synthase, partial [Candidatus Saccharimonadales bacterium]